ncbi:beta-1,3-glucanase family protein (plasmid) [Streptomyces sp. JL4002]|uniref:beta-1,3-glucanase family protein n=1 Tax=Streptomyces sp. JL4002 TaxID=3404781 RepID=UPI003B27F3E5
MRLVNKSGLTAYAYVTGFDPVANELWPPPGFLDKNGEWQYLAMPKSNLEPVVPPSLALQPDASIDIPLTPISSGRVWFSLGDPLQFFVNTPVGQDPRPSLAQPDWLNGSDVNIAKKWTFCEFTYDASSGLYVNISYVDLTALPISLELTGTNTGQVPGLPSGALDRMATALNLQQERDGAPWGKLVARNPEGQCLRISAPHFSKFDFTGYWSSYVSDVWSNYERRPLSIDIQDGSAPYQGLVRNGLLVFAKSGASDPGAFSMPSSADIFGCNSGPFENEGSAVRKAIAARIGAAFNRATLLLPTGDTQPDGVPVSGYYQNETCNHYARIVHEYTKVGYAFSYDDVLPVGVPAVDGHLADPNPQELVISVSI